MASSATVGRDLSSLFGDPSLTEVDRAIAELRAVRPVLLASEGQHFLVSSAEFASADRIALMDELADGKLKLVLSPARLRGLGRPDIDVAMAIAAGALYDDRVLALIAEPNIQLVEELVAAGDAGEAALEIARLALLLPAVLMAPLAPAAMPMPATMVHADAIMQFGEHRAMRLKLVSRAPVPLLSEHKCEFVIFRGGQGMREQVAVIVGTPDPAASVLVRLHSACLTGDLFGSLVCDCGDQLRATVSVMAQSGGGVILYLDQEGRGHGIANKMRAYRLQRDGLDTYDADATLGFDRDGRRFDFAADMLRQLGYSQVILMTNNPEKIEALRRAGLDVTGVERIYGRPGIHNLRYLTAKRDKAGHLLDLDAPRASRPNGSS